MAVVFWWVSPIGDSKFHTMPDYQSLTIHETLCRINGRTDGALFLPALQRHFVWPYDKISKLFDSIMRDYPIGTFLFWEVDEQRQEESSFYSFIQDYSEFGDGKINQPAGRSLPRKILGVLDGQQRLNSMYVALLGSYSYYDGGRGCARSSPAYYLKRHYYINPLWAADEDADHAYQFSLLTDHESAPATFTANKCWFRVGDVFYLKNEQEVEARWQKLRAGLPPTVIISEGNEARALTVLKKLWAKICQEALITYYPVRNRSLSEALEIFVRMNRGGVELSLRELYFSTIAANWKAGRDEIEKLERELNAIGNGFKFEVNSLMLACLVLSGNPVRLKVESFRPSNVELIRLQWAEICTALTTATQLVAKWSYSGISAVSLNAIIGIAIIVRRGLDVTRAEQDMRMFLIKSVIRGIYDRRAERTLAAVRTYIDTVPQGSPFVLADFISGADLPSDMTLEFKPDDIEALLDTQIWNSRAYVLLSLLHGHHALHQQAFEKDHIHPNSKFDNLSALNLGWEREARWRDLKDRLPNLQLLQSGENNNKRAKPFADWLPIYRPEERSRAVYLDQNDIPADSSLAFGDFEKFYESRKQHLRSKLAQLLDLA